MNEPLISVIVPIYKVEKYLRKCVDSILAQTYTHLEIILVDDGSPDNCGAICDEYAAKDSRIKVIHKENGGLSDARNAGLDIAKGEYIGFVDSDDYIAPNMYGKLYAAAQKNNADLVICECNFVYENGIRDKNHISYLKNQKLSKKKAFTTLCGYDYGVYTRAYNKLYKNKIFIESENTLRYPTGKICEDAFLIHHIINRCEKVVTISDKLYFYVNRNDSIMSHYTLKTFKHGYEAVLDRTSFFYDIGEKELANKSYRTGSGNLLFSALQRIDMTVTDNRKAVLTLYWKILPKMIISLDFWGLGCLILARNKQLWFWAKGVLAHIRYLKIKLKQKLSIGDTLAD